MFAVDVCYLEKCCIQYQFCLNVINHEYFFKVIIVVVKIHIMSDI